MLSAAEIDSFTLDLGRGSEVALVICLATMMFAVALNLSSSSFAFLRTAPRAYFIGLVGQIVALPLMTLGLVYLIEPIPSVALGMILVASCPGGNVSNILVLLARGNAALSVTLTATSSVLAAFVTPAAILFWSSLYAPTAELLTKIDFDPMSFLIKTATVLALPLVLGMLFNACLPRLAERLRRPLVILSSGLLFAIVIVGLSKYWPAFVELGASLLGLVVLHNALAFSLGNVMARLGRISVADRRALTYEVGIQNAGLGIVILLTQMGGLGGAAVMTGVWSIWHMVAGLTLALVFRLSDRRR